MVGHRVQGLFIGLGVHMVLGEDGSNNKVASVRLDKSIEVGVEKSQDRGRRKSLL